MRVGEIDALLWSDLKRNMKPQVENYTFNKSYVYGVDGSTQN